MKSKYLFARTFKHWRTIVFSTIVAVLFVPQVVAQENEHSHNHNHKNEIFVENQSIVGQRSGNGNILQSGSYIPSVCNPNTVCGRYIKDKIGEAIPFDGSSATYSTEICMGTSHNVTGGYEAEQGCDNRSLGACPLCCLSGLYIDAACSPSNQFSNLGQVMSVRSGGVRVGNALSGANFGRIKFIYFKVESAGVFNYTFSFNRGSTTNMTQMDVDWGIWGPFDNKQDAFTNVGSKSGWTSGALYTNGVVPDVGVTTESGTFTFTSAHVGKVFVMMVSPYFCPQYNFNVTLTQTNKGASGAAVLASANSFPEITNLTATATICNAGVHSVSGTITYRSLPSGGRLVVSTPRGAITYITSYTANSTANNNISYSLSNIQCGKGDSTISNYVNVKFEYPMGTAVVSNDKCYDVPIMKCARAEIFADKASSVYSACGQGQPVRIWFADAFSDASIAHECKPDDNKEYGGILNLATTPVTFTYTVDGVPTTVTNYSGANPYVFYAKKNCTCAVTAVSTAQCGDGIISTTCGTAVVDRVEGTKPTITGPSYVVSCGQIGTATNTQPMYTVSDYACSKGSGYYVQYLAPGSSEWTDLTTPNTLKTSNTFFFGVTPFLKPGVAEYDKIWKIRVKSTSICGGCESEPIEVRRIVSSNVQPELTASAADFCDNSSITLTVERFYGAPLSYQTWAFYKLQSNGTLTEIQASSAACTCTISSVQSITSGAGRYVVKYTGKTHLPSVGCFLGTADTITIGSCEPPVAPTVSADPETLCAGNASTLTAGSEFASAIFKWYTSATGGTAIYTGNPYIVSPSSTTTYYVEQTVAGRTSTRTAKTITVNASPAAPSVSPGTTIYNTVGTKPTMTASGVSGATFAWYGSTGLVVSSNASFTSNQAQNAGTYVYTVTQTVNGCESPATTVTIITAAAAAPSAPTLSGTTTICSGSSATLSLSGLTSGNTYNIYTSGGVSVASGTASGSTATVTVSPTYTTTYYATQTNSNGTSEHSGTVTITVASKPNTPTITPSTTTSCASASVILTLSNLTVGATCYIVSSSGSTSFYVNSSTATRSVTVSSTTSYYAYQTYNGCRGDNSSSVTITASSYGAPTVSAVANPICSGANPQIFVSNMPSTGTKEIVVYDNDAMQEVSLVGSHSTTGTSMTVTLPAITSSATYYVTYDMVGTGCESSHSSNITFTISSPTTPTAVSVTPSSSCLGTQLTFSQSGQSGATYKWYRGSETTPFLTTTANSATYTPTSTYTGYVYVSQTIGGCESPRQSYGVSIVSGGTQPTVTASTTTPCYGNSVALSVHGTSGATFKWYDSSTSTTPLQNGTSTTFNTTQIYSNSVYYVSEVSSGGCESSRASITITPIVTPAPTVTSPISGCAGSTVTLSASGTGTLDWYTVATGGTSFATGSSVTSPVLVSGANNFYVSQYSNSCQSSRAQLTVNASNAPTPTITPSTLQVCGGSSFTLTVSNYTSGATVNWYRNGVLQASTTSATYSFTAPTSSGSYTYTANQVVGSCISGSGSASITVSNSTPPAPSGLTATPSSVCGSQNIELRCNTYTWGATIKWYNAAGSLIGTGNPCSTTISESTTFYASQAFGDCEGPKSTSGVLVTYSTAPNAPMVTSPTGCAGNNISIFVSSMPTSGNKTIHLYDSSNTLIKDTVTSSNYIYLNVRPTGTTTYYISYSLDGCESNKAQSTVTVTTVSDPTPTGATICSGEMATLSAGNAAGTTARWYATATSTDYIYLGSSYQTPSLTSSQTYYVAAFSGSCSSNRVAVTATVTASPVAPTPTQTSYTICSDGSAEIGLTGMSSNSKTIKIYTSSGALAASKVTSETTTTLSVSPTELTQYYATTTEGGGCESAHSSLITVNVQTSQKPTVTASNSTVCAGGTITLTATNVPTGGLVYWYDSYNNPMHTSTTSPYTYSFSAPSTLGNNTFYASTYTSVCGESSKASTTVNIVAGASAPTVTPAAPQICSGTGISLTASSSNSDVTGFTWYAADGVTVLQTTGSTYNTGILTQTTTYKVTQTTTCGESAQKEVTVTVNNMPAAPTVSPANPTVCSGNSITLTASGESSATFAWYEYASGGTALSTSVLFITPALTSAKTYYVSQTTSCGTSSRKAVTVNISTTPGVPTVSAEANPICSGGTAKLTASGVSGATFNWYDSSTATIPLQSGTSNIFTTPSLTSAKTYYVSQTTSCGTSARASITVNMLAAPTPLSSASSMCSNSQLTLTAQNYESGAIINWYNSDGVTLLSHSNPYTTSISVASTMVKKFYVSQTKGCESPKTLIEVIVYPLPTIPSVTDQSVCYGSRVTLTATSAQSGVSFLWYDASGAFIMETSTGTYSPTMPITTNTSFKVATKIGTCSSQVAVINVSLKDRPATPVLSANPTAVCVGEQSEITASGLKLGANVTWYDSSYTVLKTSAGITSTTDSYTATINNTSAIYVVQSYDGCPSDTATITVSANPIPSAPIASISSSAICNGESFNLIASGLTPGAELVWYDASTNVLVTSITVSSSSNTASISITESVSTTTTKQYYAKQFVNGCESAASATVSVTIGVPSSVFTLSAYPAVACPHDIVGLYITGGVTGARYKCYESLTTTTALISTTNTFVNIVAENVTQNDKTRTFYISQVVGGCESERKPISFLVRHAPLKPDVSPTSQTICPGETATITATGESGATFSWYAASSGGDALANTAAYTTPTLSTTTRYYATQTVNGCETEFSRTEATVYVENLPAPTVTPAAPSVCKSSPSIQLTASGTGTEFKWYDAATGGTLLHSAATYTVNPTTTTTYYVEQKGSSCTSPRTAVVVTVNETAVPTYTLANAATCPGDVQTITLTNVDNTNSIGAWYSAAVGGIRLSLGSVYTFNPMSSGIIYASRNINGCESARLPINYTVNPKPSKPTNVSANPTLVCLGDGVTLTASIATGATVKWYDSNMAVVSTSQTAIVYPTTAATHRYYVAQTVDGCESDKESVLVTVVSTPSAPLASVSPTAQCAGSDITLTANNVLAGATVLWYTSAAGGSPICSSVATGTTSSCTVEAQSGVTKYYVAQKLNNCESTRSAVSVTVKPIPAAPSSISFTQNPICKGDGVEITLNGYVAGARIKWYDTQSGTTSIYDAVVSSSSSVYNFTPTQSTTYTVTQTINGCESPGTSALLTVKPLPTKTEYASFCNGRSFYYYGQTYTAAGTYNTKKPSSTGGCDTAVTLILSELPKVQKSMSGSYCPNEAGFKYNGQYYDAREWIVNKASVTSGCDTVVTLTVTKNEYNTKAVFGSYCQGTSGYTYNGATFHAGTYTYPEIARIPSLTGGCDTTVTLTVTEDPVVQVVVNGSYCEGTSGFYYRGIIYQENRTVTFNGQNGDCDTAVTINVTKKPIYNLSINKTICIGDSYMFGGINRTATGNYTVTFQTVAGCDSVVTLHLTVQSKPTKVEYGTYCEGTAGFAYNGNIYTAGTYSVIKLSGTGYCDTLVTLNVSSVSRIPKSMTVGYCSGEQGYYLNGTYYTAGYYPDINIPSQTTGCDTVLSLTVVKYLRYVNLPQYDTICVGENYTFNGVTAQYTTTGTKTLSASYQTTHGCDSSIVMYLYVKDLNTLILNKSYCEGGSFVYNGVIYNAPGRYPNIRKPSLTGGCDTIVTLNLTELKRPEKTINGSYCEGTTGFVYNGLTYTYGTHTIIKPSLTGGCDTVVTLNVTEVSKYTKYLSAGYCSGESGYTYKGIVYTASPTPYVIDVPSLSGGCDTMVNLLVSVYPKYSASQNAHQFDTICVGESYTYGSSTNTYNTIGVFMLTENFPTAHGCDSLVRLYLNVKAKPIVATRTVSYCSGDAGYVLNGHTYTEGHYSNILKPSETGSCDTTITNLYVTIKTLPTKTIAGSYCTGRAGYVYKGTTYTYGNYTFTESSLTGGCDTAVTLNVTMLPDEPKTVTGSYCSGSAGYLYHGVYYTMGTHPVHVSSTNPNACDTAVTLIISISSNILKTINGKYCENSPQGYYYDGTYYTEAGSPYTLTKPGISGCDTTIKLYVTKMAVYDNVKYDTICAGSSYSFDGTTTSYPTAGNYSMSAILLSSTGCDSAVTVYLRVNKLTNNVSATFCEDGSYTYNGRTYTSPGVYPGIVVASQTGGCDTIVTLTLTQTNNVRKSLNVSYCYEASGYVYNGANYPTGDHEIPISSLTGGCDTILTLHVTQQAKLEKTVYGKYCEGESGYSYNGHIYTQGNYALVNSAVAACDTFVTLIVTENKKYNIAISDSICNGEVYNFNGVPYTAAGTYIDTLVSQNGCDSIVTLNLSVITSYNIHLYDTICDGDTYSFNGSQYSEPGNYPAHYTTASGCDSTITLHLEVLALNTKNITTTICQGDSIVIGSGVYKVGGTFPIRVLGQNGDCDSIGHLYLTVNPSYNRTSTASICQGDSYTFNGATTVYNTAGTFNLTYNGTTVNGCDSIVNVTLTVKPKSAPVTISRTICQGGNYTVGTHVYTTSGTYIDTLVSRNGCDSIVTLHLTVNPTFRHEETHSACGAYTWPINHVTYTRSGTQTHVFTSSLGCDSTYVLHLTINKAYDSNISATICQGDSYTFGGSTQTYNTPGTFTRVYNGHTAAGCDSIIHLTLKVGRMSDTTINATICTGSEYIVGNTHYSAAGNYVDYLTTRDGCDSIVRLNLTVEKSCNPQVINIPNLLYNVIYGVSPFSFNASVSSGLPLTLSVSGNSANVVDAGGGKYNATVQRVGTTVATLSQAGNDYYAPIDANVTINVAPATLTIKADNFTITQGDPMPSYTCKYSGWVYGEDSTALSRLPTLNGSVSTSDIAGEYLILIGGAEAENYTITYINGILTILKGSRVGCERYNAFTPYNNDGYNDTFVVFNPKTCDIKITELMIFDRWGKRLYKGAGAWNGRYHGDMVEPGVYYYVATDASGNKYTGSVDLLK